MSKHINPRPTPKKDKSAGLTPEERKALEESMQRNDDLMRRLAKI